MEIEHGLLIIKMVFASLTLTLNMRVSLVPTISPGQNDDGAITDGTIQVPKTQKYPFLQITHSKKSQNVKIQIFISIMKSF